MWAYDGIQQDLKKLADKSCKNNALSECAALLELSPVQSVVAGQPKSIQAYVLREFLRAVVNRADEGDVATKAAGALIGLGSSPGKRKEFRQGDAAAILGLEARTVRHRENEAQLIEALANAVMDFTRDVQAADDFVQANRLWLASRQPAQAKDSSASDKNMVDVVGELLKSAEHDPVAAALFDRVTMGGRYSTDPKAATQWRRRLQSHYELRSRVEQLGATLLAALQMMREKPHWDAVNASQGLKCSAPFQVVHARLYIFILRHGGLWVLDDPEVEQEVCESISRLYSYAPIHAEDDAWLQRLLAREQVGEKLNPVERVRTIPAMPAGPDVYREWQQFLNSCDCQDDEHPHKECRAHAMILECNRYSKLVEKLLVRQFTAPDDPRPA